MQKLEKDKAYERVNSLKCTTPHLTREIKAYNKYELDEVWSSTLYFKRIEYKNAEDFANNATKYCNNDLWSFEFYCKICFLEI